MSTLKQLQNHNDFLGGLNSFINVFQQITVKRMNDMRQKVFNNRNYMQGLADVLMDIRYSFIETPHQKTHAIKITTLAKNNKTAVIVLSRPDRFAGHINYVILDALHEAMTRLPDDSHLFVIGELGKTLIESKFGEYQPLTVIDQSDAQDRDEQILSALSETTKNFKHVFIFGAKLESLMRQLAHQVSLTGDISDQFGAQKAVRQQRHYLFEPDRTAIEYYFEKQVFSGLLFQTQQETRLAFLGSQISNLELTRKNVEDSLVTNRWKEHKLYQALQNKAQRERLACLELL